MFSFRRWSGCATLLALGFRLAAAPPLTTIQDVLYTADGNRFNGLATISWKSFEASDTSNIGAQTTKVEITNGILYVQLVPTTTSPTAATYAVQYQTGRTQFTEVWVVPPSATALRVRDVRLGPGAVTTPGVGNGTSITVQISDVTGLQSALNLRPTMGTSFTVSRAAVINSVGSIDGAMGNLSDCLHVDGTSGSCGTGSTTSGSVSFVDSETPGGTVDGSNTTFTLANAPNPSSSVALFRNGLLMKPGMDYTVSGSSVLFQTGVAPQPGDTLLASYRLSVSLPGVGFVDGETPAGTSNGVNTTFTLAQTPNPSASLALYRNGIRLKSGLDFSMTGNTVTFLAGIPQTGDVLLCSYRVAQ